MRRLIALFFIFFVIGAATPVLAISDAEKQLYAASANTPTEFNFPSAIAPQVMTEAQNLMNDWGSFDTYKNVMQIEYNTPSLIQTYDPTGLDIIGWKIECNASSPSVDTMGVTCLYYAGNIFSVRHEASDGLKRARMMSYLLQDYTNKYIANAKAEAAAAPPAAPPAPTLVTIVGGAPPNTAPTANVTDEEKLYIQLIQTQISAQDFDGALTSLGSLKIAIEKDKAAAAAAPKVEAPTTTPAAPASAQAAAAPPPAQWYVFTMSGGIKFVGSIKQADDGTGYMTITNSQGDRSVKNANVLSKAAVASEAEGKSQGATD